MRFPRVFLFLATVIGIASPSLLAETKEANRPETTKEPEDPGYRVDVFDGKVIPYRDAVAEAIGSPLAGDWGADLLAMVTTDGDVLPILPTDEARFFHQDERNLDRPVRVRARVYDATPGLHLLDIHPIIDGEPHEMYYWCDVCAIRRYWLTECECCQGPVEVRHHPIGERYRLPDPD